MKKVFLGIVLLAFSVVVPVPAAAEVDIRIGISLPPLFSLSVPPNVIIIPDTDSVYVVPDIDMDVFFWSGWWWMPWEGRWYRSRFYDRGWAYYSGIPRFYHDVNPDWRRYFRERSWYGHRWNYERIPHHQLQQNWRSWHNSRYWEKRGTWGVQNYRPRPTQRSYDARQPGQQQYQQRPGDQRHLQQRRDDPSRSRIHQPPRPPAHRPQVPASQAPPPPGRPYQDRQPPGQRPHGR